MTLYSLTVLMCLQESTHLRLPFPVCSAVRLSVRLIVRPTVHPVHPNFSKKLQIQTALDKSNWRSKFEVYRLQVKVAIGTIVLRPSVCSLPTIYS